MPPVPNQQLFEYRIERVLGQGAFGTVYLAHDTLLDRPVAIKELTITAQTDEGAFKRFLQEARAAGGLNHPHIVTVHALKVVEPEVYLVMEYLAGGSLRALLEQRGRLPVEEAVRIAAGVCEGLAAAHAKGIVHRDVKPENILLTEDGKAKVGDFGIAHVPRGAGGTKLTQAGFQPGTLLYMSPEQIRGQRVDGRSDVYQVGALLYEMLAGWHYVDLEALQRQARETAGSNVMLFQARLYELLAEAICGREPGSVCRLRPEVPGWVGEIVAAALAKGVEERPAAEELSRALLGVGELVRMAAPIIPPIVQTPLPQPGVEVSLLYTLEGHTQMVSSVAFSPDGRTLASGSWDKTVRLWDVTSGQEMQWLEGHTDRVSGVAFSPDGHTLASSSYDKTVRLWDVASARLLRRLEGHTLMVSSVAFSPDGGTLASSSPDGTMRLWDVAGGQEIRRLQHGSPAHCVAFSPDGRLLASGVGIAVQVWHVSSGRELRQLEGHTRAVVSVGFSPDGHILASASGDRTVRLWDVQSGREVRQWKEQELDGVSSVAFSPDGRILASASGSLPHPPPPRSLLHEEGIVRLWDVGTGCLLRQLEGHTRMVWSVAFSPDGRMLASGSFDRTVRLWVMGTEIGEHRQGEKSSRPGPAETGWIGLLKGHTSSVNSIAFGSDGRILASGSADRSVRLWNVESGREVRRLEGHRYGVLSVAFSPDGRILASGGGDKTIRFWDVESGQDIRQFTGHPHWASLVTCIAFSPDRHILASAGGDDKTVRLWDLASGQLLRQLEGRTDWVGSVAFSPDGRILASASKDKTVRLWDVETGRLLRQLEGHTDWIRSVSFSPDGRFLVSGGQDHTVRLWDAADNREIRCLKDKMMSVNSVTCSPSGHILASGNDDKAVRLWDVETGRLLRRLEGHTNWVNCVAFSPDGRILASGSWDKTVRLWRVK